MKAENPSNEGQVIDDELVLVPEGIYDLWFLDYQTRFMLGKTPKLYMRFKIVECGEHKDKFS